MAIIYKHIRKDNNEIFYIGIGKTIKRAKSTFNRNSYWHNIVKKVGYNIEIFNSDCSWEEACEKEKELIKLYGRRDLGTGSLVNMTDGGEGVLGLKWTDEQRQAKTGTNHHLYGKKQSEAQIKNKLGKNSPLYGRKAEKHPMYNYKFSEEAKKLVSKRMLNNKYALGFVRTDEEKENLRIKLKGNKNSLGYRFTEEQKANLGKGHNKPIIQYTLGGDFIKEWRSVKEAGIETGISRGGISTNLKNKRKSAGGYIWKYKNNK